MSTRRTSAKAGRLPLKRHRRHSRHVEPRSRSGDPGASGGGRPDLIDDAASTLASIADAKSVELKVEATAPSMSLGDRKALKQIVGNIMAMP